jgi:phosphatidylglycerophosphatase A
MGARADYRLSWREAHDPEALLVCGLGSGFVPFAPGTWGSLVAVLLWWWLLSPLAVVWQLAIIVAVFLAGTWLTGRVQKRYGVLDDSAIVVDEFVGQWLALLALPQNVLLASLGFALFRLLDILKPGPIRVLERRLGGPLGVMADDVLAGVLAAAVLQITLFGLRDTVPALS